MPRRILPEQTEQHLAEAGLSDALAQAPEPDGYQLEVDRFAVSLFAQPADDLNFGQPYIPAEHPNERTAEIPVIRPHYDQRRNPVTYLLPRLIRAGLMAGFLLAANLALLTAALGRRLFISEVATGILIAGALLVVLALKYGSQSLMRISGDRELETEDGLHQASRKRWPRRLRAGLTVVGLAVAGHSSLGQWLLLGLFVLSLYPLIKITAGWYYNHIRVEGGQFSLVINPPWLFGSSAEDSVSLEDVKTIKIERSWLERILHLNSATVTIGTPAQEEEDGWAHELTGVPDAELLREEIQSFQSQQAPEETAGTALTAQLLAETQRSNNLAERQLAATERMISAFSTRVTEVPPADQAPDEPPQE